MKYYILFLVIIIIFIAGCASTSKYSKASLDNLANCLADKNVKEYGAFWCPNCAKQEKMFGDSHKIIKERGVYIECDPRCKQDDQNSLPAACRGVIGQAEKCIEEGVDKYPTWTFPDGSKLVGVQDLEVIAQKSSCDLKSDV